MYEFQRFSWKTQTKFSARDGNSPKLRAKGVTGFM